MISDSVKCILTIENHSVIGGLGSAISEQLAQKSKHSPIRFIGVEDVFTESGSATEVKEKYGLNVDNIIRKFEDVIL